MSPIFLFRTHEVSKNMVEWYWLILMEKNKDFRKFLALILSEKCSLHVLRYFAKLKSQNTSVNNIWYFHFFTFYSDYKRTHSIKKLYFVCNWYVWKQSYLERKLKWSLGWLTFRSPNREHEKPYNFEQNYRFLKSNKPLTAIMRRKGRLWKWDKDAVYFLWKSPNLNLRWIKF